MACPILHGTLTCRTPGSASKACLDELRFRCSQSNSTTKRLTVSSPSLSLPCWTTLPSETTGDSESGSSYTKIFIMIDVQLLPNSSVMAGSFALGCPRAPSARSDQTTNSHDGEHVIPTWAVSCLLRAVLRPRALMFILTSVYIHCGEGQRLQS
ncbi:hypothetical protein BD413DRAFT_291439 [Trametes elegans]|nr:hypothetical protein BD413DRAFT_291439 [Trametes elegans]